MTKSLPITFSFICLMVIGSSCNSAKEDNKFMEGDLYFSILRFGSFYNEPDSIINKVEKYMDTVNRNTLDPEDKKFLAMYEILKSEKLLYKPYIDLKMDNDSIVKIYFENKDYDKIKIYHLRELQDTKMKIRIKVKIKDLGNELAYCSELININKVPGQTFQVGKKFKIEDYQ